MNATTRQEGERLNGIEVRPSEVAYILDRQRRQIEPDDLMEIVYEKFREINEALTDGDHCEIGSLIESGVRELVASRASHEIFQRAGCVRPTEVRL